MQKQELKRMVEVEDYDMLRKMGTAELLRMLLSDIRQGITTASVKGDIDVRSLEADITAPAEDSKGWSLAERRRTYGENKARVWDIHQSVSEAWRPVASIDFLHTI